MLTIWLTFFLMWHLPILPSLIALNWIASNIYSSNSTLSLLTLDKKYWIANLAKYSYTWCWQLFFLMSFTYATRQVKHRAGAWRRPVDVCAVFTPLEEQRAAWKGRKALLLSATGLVFKGPLLVLFLPSVVIGSAKRQGHRINKAI